MRRAEYEGDRLPCASTSCKTRVRGRYRGTGVSAHAEGDRSGGYLQLLCPVNPVFVGASGKHQWEQIHSISLSVDESGVPCQPDSGVTGLSGGPCCVSLKVHQQTKPPTGPCTEFRPYQLEPFGPKECNPGGCGCPMEERAPFGGELAVVLILLTVLSTYCTWAVWWTISVRLSCTGSSLTSQFLKQPSCSVGSG